MNTDYPYELFFGIVGSLGTNLDEIVSQMETILKTVNFETKIIVLSDLIKQFEKYQTRHEYEDERINFLMTAGDDIRKNFNLGEALSILAINKVREIRGEQTKNKKPLSRIAYIFKSLKHPDEVTFLRKIYRSSFYLISIYSPRDTRIDYLTRKIATSRGDSKSIKYRSNAEELVQRDESEIGLPKYGQNVRDTYPKGDVFIDSRTRTESEESLKRFIYLIFGNTFYTPTIEEFGMFNAYASARRSGSLARQVS